MQPYIFTLLCLSAISVVIIKDATISRQKSSLIKVLEREELTYNACQSAKAVVNYQNSIARNKLKEQSTSDDTKYAKPYVEVITKKKRKYRSLKVPFSRPPNNSRLNLYALITEPEETRDQDVSWYAIFQRLLANVYVKAGLLEEGQESNILNAIINCKDEILSKAQQGIPDILETLVLPTDLASPFYKILKGFHKTPSLLNFLDYNEKVFHNSKVNLIFMAPEVLEAIVNDTEAYQAIDLYRRDIWNHVYAQEEEIRLKGQAAVLDRFRTRTDFRLQLREQVEILLSERNLLAVLNSKIFDYTLGSAGDYMFIVDPETGWASRCYCKSRRSEL